MWAATYDLDASLSSTISLYATAVLFLHVALNQVQLTAHTISHPFLSVLHFSATQLLTNLQLAASA
jgi:hypothetical protein